MENDVIGKKIPTHYVGIGSSAGGFESLQIIFQHMPADTGATFIILQHLAPDFKSNMAEILGAQSSMPVLEVTEGVTLLANTVYVLPARQNAVLADGQLSLLEQPESNPTQCVLDIFFQSLAVLQHRAIGVILSGAGSDGAVGLKAIKEQGGMVIAQDPNTASFDSMIQSVMRLGLADFVLPCEKIPQKIIEYIRNLLPADEFSIKSALQANGETIGKIFDLLRQETNIDFSFYKHATIARRIERRLWLNQIKTLAEYLVLLKTQTEELQVLGKELLIGVTQFFREPKAFEIVGGLLEGFLLSEEKPTRTPLRIWSVGCSTGEEAYSIAIICHEYFLKHQLFREVKIFATDISRDALAFASNGRYPLGIGQQVSADRLRNYFNLENDAYVVKREIREMVIFAHHNIFNDPPFSNTHLVLCRNLLIYLQYAMQKKALAGIHFSLKNNGILFLGSSESLGELQANFEVVHAQNKVFRKLPNRTMSAALLPSTLSTLPIKSMMPIRPLVKLHYRESTTLNQSSVDEHLISHYVPPCIVLNEQHQAVHVYGDVSDYVNKMQAGKVTTNLKDLIVSELSVVLSAALSRAKSEKSAIYYTDIHTQKGLINLRVIYIKEGDQAPTAPHFVVIFEPATQLTLSEEEQKMRDTSFNMSAESRQRIIDLEKELKKEHESLQVALEKLEVFNEELQSANEELMTTNEELQSTNEELQSVNEELFTMNSEYQEKLLKLTATSETKDLSISVEAKNNDTHN